MSKWQHRSVVYKLTLGFLYFIFLVYALSFSIPTWWGIESTASIVYFLGLWVICGSPDNSGDLDNCGEHAFGTDTAWMDGVRGVWVGGMFFYVLAVVYSVVENFCSREDSRDHGLTGALALLAGLCGAVGVIVVAIKVEELSPLGGETTNYYWGFMLACISSGLTLILAIILLITRNVKSSEKSSDVRTADYVFAHKQPNPYAPEYTNQGFTRDDIPLANGVTYHHTPTPAAAHPYTMYQDGYNSSHYPQTRIQGGGYGQPVKSPYGYYNGRPNKPQEPSDVSTAYTDLSNGYTSELITAEHTLSRTNVGPRADYAQRGGDYAKQDVPARNEYYPNGSRLY